MHRTETRPTYRAFGPRQLDRIPELERLQPEHRRAIAAVAEVLPFKTNSYVVSHLIDWDAVPEDPIFQLTFPQPDMLAEADLARIVALLERDTPREEVRVAARSIQERLNPHPAGQRELNVPEANGERLAGSQHKYRETMLFFPAQGQTCHAYCTYCFRWAQFVGVDELKFANREAETLVRYVAAHPELTDVLFTGGDPLIMKAKVLRRYVEPLLDPAIEHLQTIRIGSKALSYWPYRFTTDDDADDLLRLFEQVRESGRQLALMAHFSHPRELSTQAVREAVRRVRDAGAVIRCQAPLIRHVNDHPDAWAGMWRTQVALGMVPYYMFVERDTGPSQYFSVPLVRGLEIFNRAYAQVSGLARTVRGPSMSATPGKILVDGELTVDDSRYLVLKVLQGRDPDWVGRMFLARYDAAAAWLDELEPPEGEDEFFFAAPLRAMREGRWQPAWKGPRGVDETTRAAG